MFNTKPMTNFLAGFKNKRPDAAEYEFVSPYIASTAPIEVKHLVCGKTFDTTPINMTRKDYWQVCPHCNKPRNSMKTFEDIKEEIEVLGKGEFELLKDVTDKERNHLLTIKHHECGAEFEAYRNNVVTWKLICPNCKAGASKRKSVKVSTEQMKKRIKRESLGRYELISEYQGSKEPVVILDTETNEEDILLTSNLYAKMRKINPALKPRKQRRLSQEEVEEKIIRDSDGRYKIVGPYKGSEYKVDVLDTETGEITNINYQTLRVRIHKLQKQKSLAK